MINWTFPYNSSIWRTFFSNAPRTPWIWTLHISVITDYCEYWNKKWHENANQSDFNTRSHDVISRALNGNVQFLESNIYFGIAVNPSSHLWKLVLISLPLSLTRKHTPIHSQEFSLSHIIWHYARSPHNFMVVKVSEWKDMHDINLFTMYWVLYLVEEQKKNSVEKI